MMKIVALFSIYGLCSGNRLLLQNLPPNMAYPAPPGQQYGNFGQLCTPPDPTTAICASKSDIATDNPNPGIIKCERPNDCCLCQSITCGSDTQPCEMLSVGDNGAFGVKSVSVISDRMTANIIDCKGTKSCAGTVIRGKHIQSIQCGGRYSCENAIIIIDEPNEGFNLKCGVTGACDGLQIALNIPAVPAGFTCEGMTDYILESIECIGVEACKNLNFIINNDGCRRMLIETIECRDQSCEGAAFKLNGNIHIDQCLLSATGIQPMGLDRCFSGLQSLKCVECAGKERSIVDVRNGFQLDCDNEGSCRNSVFYFDFTRVKRDELYIAITINCHGRSACENMSALITNANEKEVQINIKCMNSGSCNNAVVTSGLNTVMSHILCADPSFCVGGTVNGAAML